jgi:SAM-dependent methyltransferase
MSNPSIKSDVRSFYDQIGWKMESDGFYQNARYEDLRPVSREYIQRCHLRVNRHLQRPGKYLLDAGSGPIQYPAYLTYMEGYQYRLCLDISIVALKEARQRIGNRGLFVVADVANLPFQTDVFDGIVSLHTLHHLPLTEQQKAYQDLNRVLAPNRTAVLVNGWTRTPLMERWAWLVRGMERLSGWVSKLKTQEPIQETPEKKKAETKAEPQKKEKTGTFVEKLDADWLRRELAGKDLKILVWRSVSVRFLRAVIHPFLAGKLWLKLLYALEEKNPAYYGEQGQYPLIVFTKN